MENLQKALNGEDSTIFVEDFFHAFSMVFLDKKPQVISDYNFDALLT